MLTVKFSIHVKCQSLKTFPVEKLEVFRVFSFKYCQVDDYGNSFQMNDQGLYLKSENCFSSRISWILPYQWDLQVFSNFHNEANARLCQDGEQVKQVTFMTTCNVCNTLKPYLCHQLLSKAEIRAFLQTVSGSWTPGTCPLPMEGSL